MTSKINKTGREHKEMRTAPAWAWDLLERYLDQHLRGYQPEHHMAVAWRAYLEANNDGRETD